MIHFLLEFSSLTLSPLFQFLTLALVGPWCDQFFLQLAFDLFISSVLKWLQLRIKLCKDLSATLSQELLKLLFCEIVERVLFKNTTCMFISFSISDFLALITNLLFTTDNSPHFRKIVVALIKGIIIVHALFNLFTCIFLTLRCHFFWNLFFNIITLEFVHWFSDVIHLNAFTNHTWALVYALICKFERRFLSHLRNLFSWLLYYDGLLDNFLESLHHFFPLILWHSLAIVWSSSTCKH